MRAAVALVHGDDVAAGAHDKLGVVAQAPAPPQDAAIVGDGRFAVVVANELQAEHAGQGGHVHFALELVAAHDVERVARGGAAGRSAGGGVFGRADLGGGGGDVADDQRKGRQQQRCQLGEDLVLGHLRVPRLLALTGECASAGAIGITPGSEHRAGGSVDAACEDGSAGRSGGRHGKAAPGVDVALNPELAGLP